MHESEHGRLREPRVDEAGEGHTTEIPVLGIVTRFASNSPDVLGVVEEAFGAWRSLAATAIGSDKMQTVRVMVQATAPGHAADGHEVTHLIPGDGRLIIRARDALGISDPRRHEAVGYVSTELLRDRRRFRYDVLEALTWALLTRRDRQPLHAAAIVRDGTGLLLCGASGAGKSTLAYAAVRAGMRMLSEDIVFLQTEPRLRVWGMPGTFRLLPSAASDFEELSAAPAELHNGRQKVMVRAQSIGAAARERVLDECGVCVLGERRATPKLRRMTSAEALKRLDLGRDAGFDVFAESIAPAVERLAENGAWLLCPSASPAASVPLLARMLDDMTAARVESRS